ncbi:MAG: hypothetical protein U9R56_03795, partial [candidate division Zixibacteria bacterium]|nr:hypothetical protein [candidate division Zixibacteria bacterium]
QMATYIPRVSFPHHYNGEFKNVPLLILLPPQGADRYFYFNHGLKKLADEMISTGEIEPMLITCISNDRVFGGYFYAGDSYGAGLYDSLIGDALIEYMYNAYEPMLLKDSPIQGISGVGMGAYGAFRAALIHPGVFTSVSGVDGPLDFDGGEGYGNGLIDLMDTVFTKEQTGLNAGNFTSTFDSSLIYPVSRLFIGGSIAFSPHDTLVTVDVIKRRDVNTGLEYNTITIEDSSRYTLEDTATLITHIISEDAYNFDFHLPFNYTERPYDSIWVQYWLPNNLENLLTNSNGLNNVDIWIGTSQDAWRGYHNQTMSWLNTLQNDPSISEPTSYEYTGYSGNPATNQQYVYDLLREILVFHSNSFFPDE